MADWRYHSKALTAFRRRYRLNVDPTEVLTGILPVAQIDKHWQDDTLDLFGMYCQHVIQAGGAGHNCCVLTAGRQEVLVHEVTAWTDPAHAWGNAGWAYHLMTCHYNYNPVSTNIYSLWYPWLMASTRSDKDLVLAYALGASGRTAALQTVTTPAGLVTCYGKTLPTETQTPGAGSTALRAGGAVEFWKMSDPPLRLKPYVQLMVQSNLDQFTTQAGSVGLPFNVNFVFSERQDQGDVG